MEIRSPYVGLTPFDKAHEDYFFGRKLDAHVIVDNILTRRITILYGTSGVGKSSLLNVGLRAALREREADVELLLRNEWHDPLAAANWLDSVRNHDAREKVLVLDQFEEFFFYGPEPEAIGQRIADLIRQ